MSLPSCPALVLALRIDPTHHQIVDEVTYEPDHLVAGMYRQTSVGLVPACLLMRADKRDEVESWLDYLRRLHAQMEHAEAEFYGKLSLEFRA